MKHRNNPGYASLGASGAISAVLFSFILFMPTTKLYLFFAIGIPAFIFGPLYLIYCVYASRYQQDGVNHDAHFYGALPEIGRASCRERVCQYVKISVVAGT